MNNYRYMLISLLLLSLISFSLAAQEIPYGSNKQIGKFLSINGIKIYYEVYGSGEPLLLIHGNSQSIKDWQYQIQEFSKYHKVIVPDSRAQGNSTDSDQEITYTLMASDMALLLDSLHIKSTNVVGWSDGGNTGLHLALQYPEKLKKLITVGANFKIDSTVVSNDILDLLKDDLAKEPDVTRKKLIELMLHYPILTEKDLNQIQTEVLVMAGEFDIILPEHTKRMAAAIPHSSIEVFKEASHFIPNEKPELFNQAVLNYLGTRRGPKLSGSVIDSKTNQSIPSAVVYFNQNKEGTSTDLSGNFELEMINKDDSLIVSSMGYQRKALIVTESNQNQTIRLHPKDYLLKEVTVKSKPLNASLIVKQAINNLEKNYPQEKYSLEMYVKLKWKYKDGSSPTACEGILQGYNEKGYSRRVHAYFHLLNKFYFRLLEQRKQNVKDTARIMPYTSDLMYSDVIRFDNSPINLGNVKHFEFQFENIIEGIKDTVYVISFKCKKPNYWNTAQPYSTDYFGVICINSTDFAIVKYSATNIADKDLLEKKGKKTRFLIANTQYQSETTYVKHKGVYFPSTIRSVGFTYQGDDRKPITTFNSETLVYALELDNPKPIEPPKNFRVPPVKNAPFNEKFWSGFVTPTPISEKK